MAAGVLSLWAAGSLKAALGEVAAAFAALPAGVPVAAEFGAAGTLRQRIEAGPVLPDVFASANLAHPEALAARGLGGPVRTFARNRLCALTRPEIGATGATLLDAMLRPDTRLGTSTPGADPSGDYAQLLFDKVEAMASGAGAALRAKALPMTGGPGCPKAPDGRNLYAWIVGGGRADIFLTYATNAVLAQAEMPELRLVELPREFAVRADYGLTVLRPERPEASCLAGYILSPAGQRILLSYGFESATPSGEEA